MFCAAAGFERQQGFHGIHEGHRGIFKLGFQLGHIQISHGGAAVGIPDGDKITLFFLQVGVAADAAILAGGDKDAFIADITEHKQLVGELGVLTEIILKGVRLGQAHIDGAGRIVQALQIFQ